MLVLRIQFRSTYLKNLIQIYRCVKDPLQMIDSFVASCRSSFVDGEEKLRRNEKILG